MNRSTLLIVSTLHAKTPIHLIYVFNVDTFLKNKLTVKFIVGHRDYEQCRNVRKNAIEVEFKYRKN